MRGLLYKISMKKTKRKIILILEFIVISAVVASWLFSGWSINLPNLLIRNGIKKHDIGNDNSTPRELIGKRTYTSKTYANADGTYTLDAHIGQIHYEDKETKELKDIDTTLIDQGDKWTMEKASYHAEIPKYADQPMVFQDVFEDKDQTITMVPQTQPVQGKIENSDGWENKRVRYKNAFGENIDLRVTVGNIGLFKEVIVNQKPENLKDLAFDFEIKIPEGKSFYLLDGRTQEKTKATDINKLELSGEKQLLIGDENSASYIQKIRVWDSAGREINGKLRFYERDNRVYFQKIIPEEFLDIATYPVYTDDTATYYSGAGDGYIYGVTPSDQGTAQQNWDYVHGLATGTLAWYLGNEDYTAYSTCSATGATIYRAFFPVDTSALPDNAVISAATFKAYITTTSDGDNDGDDWVNIVQTSQNSTSSLVTADFDNCGAVTNPTEGATRIDITNISTGAYSTWTLNSTGMGWISKTGYTLLGLREGHDAINSKTANGVTNDIATRYSEYSGTSSDPYLYITYTATPDLSWVTGSADFKIYQSSSLTWDAGNLVCSGTLTDDNGSTINCNYLAIVPSTQYRVQVILKNTGGGAANMNGASEYIDHKNVKAGWAGTTPTLGNCAFYDSGSDDGSTTCTAAWNATNDVRITNTGAGNVVLAAASGQEGFMYLITTTSSVPSTDSTSYADATIDSDSEDSSKITILGASGSQSVDIVDGSGNSVTSPSVTFSTKDFSWSTQTSTGTFGTSSQKVRATNGTTDDTWSVNLAGSATTALWTAGSYHYDFNDSNGSGYTDGADADNYGGQMTVDPSGGTVAGVPDNTSCPITNISKGTSDSFVEGTTDSIDIFSGASGSTVPCKWDFTGASITQKIPASQASGSYSISMTLTVS